MTKENEDNLDILLKQVSLMIAEEEAEAFMNMDVSDVKFDDRYYQRKKEVLDSFFGDKKHKG